MRTEGGPTAIRVSCSLNMNDLQSQNSFDFVPKSDYNEKWHLENKCLFHNQQVREEQSNPNVLNTAPYFFFSFFMLFTHFSIFHIVQRCVNVTVSGEILRTSFIAILNSKIKEEIN